jgi:protein SCO1/2
MFRKPLFSLLALLVLSLCAGGTFAWAATQPPRLKAGEFLPPHPAPAFRLRGSDGAELNLERWRGKVVLLFFGFTNCPEVCPVTLATLTQARKALGARAGDVQVVYVTVDPERDSPQRLALHLKGFDPSFVGGTGAPESLAAVRKAYGVVANKVVTAGGYGVDHSSSVFLIDREGRLRAMMPYGRSAADYVHDVQLLLSPK